MHMSWYNQRSALEHMAMGMRKRAGNTTCRMVQEWSCRAHAMMAFSDNGQDSSGRLHTSAVET
eukprot:scaffold122034_cov32-Tisochrysis_lutea.AAC.2